MTLLDFSIRIASSILFGFLIGFERQLTGHPAGIRTNVLVSLGSSIFVLFSIIMGAPDQTRIAAQIVSGVGFLCSSIIFKDGVNVRGLNTAATIWCTAAIGVLTSSGWFFYAAAATASLVALNILLRPVSNKISPVLQYDEHGKSYQVTVVCTKDNEMHIRSIIIDHISATKLALTELESNDTANGKIKISAKLGGHDERRDEITESLIRKINGEQNISSAGWEIL
jgi:putative Mg2+ transporter-C (MgtC) family protein